MIGALKKYAINMNPVPSRKKLGPPYFIDDTHYTIYTQESVGQEMDAAWMRRVHMEFRWGEIWAEVVSHA